MVTAAQPAQSNTGNHLIALSVSRFGSRMHNGAMTLDQLSKEDRIRLMRFVCSFAWADLHVHDEERKFVKKLKLSAAEAKEVDEWLKVPPRPEEVDPGQVPLEHREIFLTAAREVFTADGEVHPNERVMFSLLDQLLR